MPKNKYRIVTDTYLGYEVQIKYWWFPVWSQLNGVNTHRSIEAAERYIERHKQLRGPVFWSRQREVVKEIED